MTLALARGQRLAAGEGPDGGRRHVSCRGGMGVGECQARVPMDSQSSGSGRRDAVGEASSGATVARGPTSTLVPRTRTVSAVHPMWPRP